MILVLLLLAQFSVQQDNVARGSTGGVNCSGPGISCKIQNGKWQLYIDVTDAGYAAPADGG